jgi:hypothetical protein
MQSRKVRILPYSVVHSLWDSLYSKRRSPPATEGSQTGDQSPLFFSFNLWENPRNVMRTRSGVSIPTKKQEHLGVRSVEGG